MLFRHIKAYVVQHVCGGKRNKTCCSSHAGSTAEALDRSQEQAKAGHLTANAPAAAPGVPAQASKDVDQGVTCAK